MGNAGYAFPYLLDATNITKVKFLSIPKPSYTPTNTARDIVGYTHIFVLNVGNLVDALLQLLGIFGESVGREKRGLSPSLKDGCSNQSQTINMDRPKTQHILKSLDIFNLTINQIHY